MHHLIKTLVSYLNITKNMENLCHFKVSFGNFLLQFLFKSLSFYLKMTLYQEFHVSQLHWPISQAFFSYPVTACFGVCCDCYCLL